MPAVEDTRADARRMLEGLLAASHLMPLEALPARVTEHAAAAGLTEVSIYIADVQGNVLRLLTGDKGTGEAGPGQEAELKVEGTLPGRSYQYVEVLADRSPGRGGIGGGCRCWTAPSASASCGSARPTTPVGHNRTWWHWPPSSR